MEAGFVHVVEVGQDRISWQKTLVTWDNFVKWRVANTLFTETIQLHNQKDGFKETRALGLYWINFQFSKRGIEIRIWFVGQDNSQFWVRISYGTTQYAVDSNHNNTEGLADPLNEEQASPTSVARSKAKANLQKKETAELQSTIPMNERTWIDIESSEPSLAPYEVSKKVVSLLRHSQR